MRTIFLTILLVATFCVAGCRDHESEARLRVQEQEIAALSADLAASKGVAQERDRLREELQDAQGRLNDAERKRVGDSAEAHTLREEVARLEQRIHELETAKAAAEAKTKEEVDSEVEDNAPPESTGNATDSAAENAAQLLGMVKVNPSDAALINELTEALRAADKPSRDRAIDELSALVAANPDDKHARMALAAALTTRFADVTGLMQQGRLASEIFHQLDKVIELDPDHLGAWLSAGLMKVNYPAFTNEFKSAGKYLAKALELQEKKPWQDDFAGTYIAYSLWYRKQGRLADAAAVLQKGLNIAPYNEQLLAAEAEIESAGQGGQGS